MIETGDPVITPDGEGVVIWLRMAGPDYVKPACFSVRLHKSANQRGYAGTVYPAEQVLLIEFSKK
jgi:hypothetical protein